MDRGIRQVCVDKQPPGRGTRHGRWMGRARFLYPRLAYRPRTRRLRASAFRSAEPPFADGLVFGAAATGGKALIDRVIGFRRTAARDTARPTGRTAGRTATAIGAALLGAGLLVAGPALAYDEDDVGGHSRWSGAKQSLAPASTGLRKKVICGMTINSKDEVMEFIKRLKPNAKASDYVFKELTEMGTDRSWFRNACSSGTKCDVLVISAHFGGTLFGDNNKIRLDLDTLEAASCNRTCDGILRHPTEVFMFTCNMLARKQRDTRTPRQYYNVLLQYYPPHLAQYYVQTRYGAWGGTFYGRTTRTFARVKNIYGFTSVSPYGKDIAPWVRYYVNSIPNYSKHLDQMKKGVPNYRLMSTLGRTGMIRVQGVQPKTFGDHVRGNLCNYFNAGSVGAKLSLLANMLKEPKFEPYLTYVEAFYRKYQPRWGSGHSSIRSNTRVKTHVLNMIQANRDMPHTRIDLVNFASAVGWINSKKRDTYLQQVLVDLFKGGLTVDRRFDICSVGRRHGSFMGKYVTLDFIEKIQPSSQWSPRFVETVGCLRPVGAKLQDKIASYMDAKKYQWKYRWSAAYTYLDTRPTTRYVEAQLRKAAKDPNPTVSQTARQAMRRWRIN